MATEKFHTPAASYFFILLLIAGVILLTFSFMPSQANQLFGGLRRIGLGFTLIGLGEWINHPLQKSVAYKDRKKLIFQYILHRKRNPSALGNLFEIVGLILIFMGFAVYM